ncbi:unnamed protein product [Closterium sp. NIES-54]
MSHLHAQGANGNVFTRGPSTHNDAVPTYSYPLDAAKATTTECPSNHNDLAKPTNFHRHEAIYKGFDGGNGMGGGGCGGGGGGSGRAVGGQEENMQRFDADGPRGSSHCVDERAAATWIYPSNRELRQYQYEIAEAALFANTLVCLPTGVGKTLIAAVVMANYYRWFPHGKIVFMAPTRPLVLQQIRACHNVVAIPQEHTMHMTGQMAREQRAQHWRERRVFFVTGQVLLQDMVQWGACPREAIVCLVVDEAHRATGNYAYARVVEEVRCGVLCCVRAILSPSHPSIPYCLSFIPSFTSPTHRPQHAHALHTAVAEVEKLLLAKQRKDSLIHPSIPIVSQSTLSLTPPPPPGAHAHSSGGGGEAAAGRAEEVPRIPQSPRPCVFGPRLLQQGKLQMADIKVQSSDGHACMCISTKPSPASTLPVVMIQEQREKSCRKAFFETSLSLSNGPLY